MMGKLLDRYIHRAALARWRKAAQQAPHAPRSQLRRRRDQARALRSQLEQLLLVADERLNHPQIGSEQFPKPVGTDWYWRPPVFRAGLARPGLAPTPRKAPVDDHATMFHDCPLGEIAIRQLRNVQEQDLAPFGLAMDVFSFEGSFLSLSLELPADAAQALTRQHVMRIDTRIDRERPVAAFARLNIQHGPNTEQVLRQMDLENAHVTLDFDLAHVPLNEARIEKIWLDLIFEHPGMNRIVLRDLTFCRYHRADL